MNNDFRSDVFQNEKRQRKIMQFRTRRNASESHWKFRSESDLVPQNSKHIRNEIRHLGIRARTMESQPENITTNPKHQNPNAKNQNPNQRTPDQVALAQDILLNRPSQGFCPGRPFKQTFPGVLPRTSFLDRPSQGFCSGRTFKHTFPGVLPRTSF